MLTSVRSLLAASVLAGAALAATPAMAQDGEESASPVSVSANVALVSDYRFRGVGLSDGDPAIQGGIDFATDPGFYVGVWGSSLGYTPAYGEMELDIYAGWSGDVTSGLTVDVGGIYYLYPSNDVDPSDYFELYGSLSGAVGPATITGGVAYAPEQDSLSGMDNLYLYANLDIGIPSTPITVSGHVGYTDGFLTYTTDSKAFDWSIGASATVIGGLSVGVAYMGVESDGPKIDGITDDTVVATLSYSM